MRVEPGSRCACEGVKWVEPGFNPLLWCPCERGDSVQLTALTVVQATRLVTVRYVRSGINADVQ